MTTHQIGTPQPTEPDPFAEVFWTPRARQILGPIVDVSGCDGDWYLHLTLYEAHRLRERLDEAIKYPRLKP